MPTGIASAAGAASDDSERRRRSWLDGQGRFEMQLLDQVVDADGFVQSLLGVDYWRAPVYGLALRFERRTTEPIKMFV